MSQACINLSGMTTLVADSDHFTRGITAQIMRGFGAEPCTLVETGKQATQCLLHNCFDLCIFEAKLPDMFCADLIRWICRLKDRTARFTPILVLSSYTQLQYVTEARDAGANLVARKPTSPQVLFDRVTWIAQASRPFIEINNYIGPDRRFKNAEPPDGNFRRKTDSDRETEIPPIPEYLAPPIEAASEAM